ncbi:hypothetical protein TNCV_4237901 [Trichonephila clavipes]|nr:hypothetical protein TNCV_4237901 [Trichonephila clavipes]
MEHDSYMYKRKSKTPPKGEKKKPKMLAKGERAYSLVDERQRGKRRLRQGEKLNFRCRKAREFITNDDPRI